jgi:hypothetical protein
MKKSLSKPFFNIQWIITSVFVPIICASISAIVIIKITERPTTFIYREIPLVEKFDTLSYFPLKEGNYWIYSCKYKTTKLVDEKKSPDTVIEKGIKKIKMTVDKVYDNGNYILFVLKGCPFAGAEGENVRFGFLLVSNKIYLVYDELKILDKLIDATIKKETLLYSFYERIPLFLEFPLYDGQKYGDLSYLTRHDLAYLNLVEKIDAYSIRNNNRLETRSVFKITQSTIPADSIMTFVPYLGITKVYYQHHGTIDEYETNLEDYFIKESK